VGEFVLIVMLIGAEQRPAIDHIYFYDFFACENARKNIEARSTVANVKIDAKCYETRRGKP